MSQVTEAMNYLKGLGSVEELSAKASSGHAPAARPKVNSHIHLPPNFSAFVSVQQAVDLAVQQGVGVVGVTNYYDYSVYGDFSRLARQHRIFPLYGLEIIALIDELVKGGVKINDPGNPGRIYICGKGVTKLDPIPPRAQAYLDTIRTSDSQRMASMVAKLAEVFAQRGVSTGLTMDAVIDMVVRRHGSERARVYLQERHICQAFQERFFELVPAAEREAKLAALLGTPSKANGDPVKIQNEIRAHLMRAGKVAFVEERFLNAEQAYDMILAMGGIPCYPTLADGTSPICPFEDPAERLIDNIQGRGYHCAEFIPIRNKPEVLSHYVKAMRKAGLVITGGTEHNTLDLLPIEPTCVGGTPVTEDVKEIFWEGACVVAAHQFLVLHGKCGFVDDQGRPNPGYASVEDRIAAFRKLGAAVIRQYMDGK